MKRHGIKARSRRETIKLIRHPIKYKISKDKLTELYHKKNMSTYQIARLYGCYPSAIYHKMKNMHNIPRRGVGEAIALTSETRARKISESVMKYPKSSFSENPVEKAYMLGFRAGDLFVRKNRYGKTIIVQCTTSKDEQLELIENLFSRYGNIKISVWKGKSLITSCLDESFDFLLERKDSIKGWILRGDEYFPAFLAGYIDAEGHFGVYNGFAEFSIGSYDRMILFLIYKKLHEMGLLVFPPKLTVKKGHVDDRGYANNGDTWRFRITRKDELLKLIELVEKHIKHQKRYKDMMRAKENIISREQS